MILLMLVNGRIRITATGGGFILGQSFLQQLHVEVIVLGHLALFALSYAIANVALKAEPECYHRIANAGKIPKQSVTITRLNGDGQLTSALQMAGRDRDVVCFDYPSTGWQLPDRRTVSTG